MAVAQSVIGDQVHEGIGSVEVVGRIVDHTVADDFNSSTLGRWVDHSAEVQGLDQLLIGRSYRVTGDQIVDRNADRSILIGRNGLVDRDRRIVLIDDGYKDRTDGSQRIGEVASDTVIDDRVREGVVAHKVRQRDVRDHTSCESYATTACRKCIDGNDIERLIAFVGWARYRGSKNNRAWDIQALIFIDRVG